MMNTDHRVKVSLNGWSTLHLHNILHQGTRCVFLKMKQTYIFIIEYTFLKCRGEMFKTNVRWGSEPGLTTPRSADSSPAVSLFLTLRTECWQCWDVMETAGLWNVRAAVYIGPGVVRAAIILVSRGNRSGLMGPRALLGVDLRCGWMSSVWSQLSHTHTRKHTVLTLQLSPEETLHPGSNWKFQSNRSFPCFIHLGTIFLFFTVW